MSGKTKVAYIGLAGVIAAAVITGVSLYLSNHNGKSNAVTATNNTVVNVAPASAPPTKPSFEPFEASVSNLPAGECAFVFSEPGILQEDELGCINTATTVYIYCTVESQMVDGSTIWDEIYYRTNWGTTGYIPDAYVYTGSNNAVMPSCVT